MASSGELPDTCGYSLGVMQMRYLHWLPSGIALVLAMAIDILKVILSALIGTVELAPQLLGVEANEMGVGNGCWSICLLYLLLAGDLVLNT